MMFKKIAGIIMLLTGIGFVIIAINLASDRFFPAFTKDDLTAGIVVASYYFFMVGISLIYYPIKNRFEKGYINNSVINKIKNENKILRLKIEQEQLNNELNDH